MKNKEKAFTLSEVIITLVVIGIVAAITVPMLSNSASDKKWNVARQKAKATIGEAFRLMTVNGEISTTNSDGTPRTTEYMVTKVLPKYLKLEKTCAPAKYGECGFPSTVKTPGGGSIGITPNNYKWTELSYAAVWNSSPTQPSIWSNLARFYKTFENKYGNTYNTSYYFRTLDGFSVAFLYNPYCVSDKKEHYVAYNLVPRYSQLSLDIVCFNAIYDMNGKKGPNKVGYDIGFIGSLYNGFEVKTAAVLPHSVEKGTNSSELSGSTKWVKLSNYCNNLSKDKDWVMPDLYEMSLTHVNYRLVADKKYAEKWFFTRTPTIEDSNYMFGLDCNSDMGGSFGWRPKNDSGINYVRCVRANALK